MASEWAFWWLEKFCSSVLPGQSFSSVVHESAILILSKAANDMQHSLHTCSGVDRCLVDKQGMTCN